MMFIILILFIIYIIFLVNVYLTEKDRVKQKNESIKNEQLTHLDLKGNLYLNENDHKATYEFQTNGNYILRDKENNKIIRNITAEENNKAYKRKESLMEDCKKSGYPDFEMYSGIDDISFLFNHVDNGNPLYPNNHLYANAKIYVVFNWNNNLCYKEDARIDLTKASIEHTKKGKLKHISGNYLNFHFYRRVTTGEIKPILESENSLYNNFVNKANIKFCKLLESYLKQFYVEHNKYKTYNMEQLNNYYTNILYSKNNFFETSQYKQFRKSIVNIYNNIYLKLISTERYLNNYKSLSKEDYLYDTNIEYYNQCKIKKEDLLNKLDIELDKLNTFY